MSFPSKLKQARLLKDYTQLQVAELAGISRTVYAAYEKGTKEPKVNTLIKIIEVLDIDANYLLKDEKSILAYVIE